jgi:hypothetical protein
VGQPQAIPGIVMMKRCAILLSFSSISSRHSQPSESGGNRLNNQWFSSRSNFCEGQVRPGRRPPGRPAGLGCLNSEKERIQIQAQPTQLPAAPHQGRLGRYTGETSEVLRRTCNRQNMELEGTVVSSELKRDQFQLQNRTPWDTRKNRVRLFQKLEQAT